MSGGHFDYQQYCISEIADEVQRLIEINDCTKVDEYGQTLGHGYGAETIERFKEGLHHLRLAAIYAQRIDWLVSCDDGEESFHQRLTKELSKEDTP